MWVHLIHGNTSYTAKYGITKDIVKVSENEAYGPVEKGTHSDIQVQEE